MDKIAIRNVSTDVRGNQVVEYIDANTGDPLPSAEGYQIVDDWQNGQPSNTKSYSNTTVDAGIDTEEPEPFWQRYRDQGNGDPSGNFNSDRSTDASNNFGYTSKPKGLGLMAAILPGPLGMAAKGVSMAINAGNTHSTNKAREYLGLEEKGLMSSIGGAMKDRKGYVGDVQFENNPNTYAVGLDAQDSKKRTTMTPDEARTRGMLAGGLHEATREEKQQNLKDFKTDKKATLEKSPLGALDLPTPSERPSVPMGKTSPVKGAVSPQSLAYHGLGLADFAPSDDPDLPTRDMAKVAYDLDKAGRSEIPSSGIGSKVSDVVTDVLGSGYTVHVTSGQEPEGRSPVGTKYRHPEGTAADLDIRDPQGRPLSLNNPQDRQAIADVAQGMAARYGGNFGMGKEYMGDKTMHMDTMDLASHPGAGPQWASFGKEIGSTLDQSRANGVMPSQYYDIENAPTPQERPAGGFDDPTQGPEMAGQDYGDRQVGGFANGPKKSSLPSYDAAVAQTTVNPDRFKGLTDEERGLMGKTLAGEIDRSQTDLSTPEGQKEAQGILSSIENRVSKYGSVTGAIQAPNQFSTWNNPAAANTATKNYDADKTTFDSIVSKYVSDPTQNLGFTSYHNQKVNPSWSAKMENPTTIGPHTFGTLPEYTAKAPTSVQPHTVFNTAAITSPTFAGKMADDSLPSFSGRTETVANRPATSSTSPTANTSGTGFARSSNDTASNTNSGSSRSAGLMSSMSTAATSASTKSTDKDKTTQGGWGQRSY